MSALHHSAEVLRVARVSLWSAARDSALALENNLDVEGLKSNTLLARRIHTNLEDAWIEMAERQGQDTDQARAGLKTVLTRVLKILDSLIDPSSSNNAEHGEENNHGGYYRGNDLASCKSESDRIDATLFKPSSFVESTSYTLPPTTL